MSLPVTTDGLMIGAVGAAITAVVTWFSFLRKNKTDETTLALEAWKELISPMKLELERMKTKETAQERLVQDLIQEVHSLKMQLESTNREYKEEREQLLCRIRHLERSKDNE